MTNPGIVTIVTMVKIFHRVVEFKKMHDDKRESGGDSHTPPFSKMADFSNENLLNFSCYSGWEVNLRVECFLVQGVQSNYFQRVSDEYNID